jgi:phosphate transport system permease protein
MPEIPHSPDPKRFEVSRATLWFDRFMGWLIRFGGIGVIVAVFGIFYFVGKEVIPLFRSAQVEPAGEDHQGGRAGGAGRR